MADEEGLGEIVSTRPNGLAVATTSAVDIPLEIESTMSESSAVDSDIAGSSGMSSRGPVAPDPEGSTSLHRVSAEFSVRCDLYLECGIPESYCAVLLFPRRIK